MLGILLFIQTEEIVENVFPVDNFVDKFMDLLATLSRFMLAKCSRSR
ncbi:hypothetical protein Thini_2485 [Thiothrix nivea DSM 5205]|uniref:Uncharacterized protein n=1 Tax=Thiothrix nivea (strain ATCC 35100 / DSM 5205 / JP2) TaxID=870187 RepID=A0A656HDQ8_THINJ|nr:hypothetical protein Thini_2485 [Thiothrix nivea DSM 5205]